MTKITTANSQGVVASRFNKRTYTAAQIVTDIANLLRHVLRYPWVLKGMLVPAGFREKIMLAVTGVNGCRYCSYFHTRMALEASISRETIEHLLRGDIEKVIEPGEWVGIAFAQHHASTNGSPTKVAAKKLLDEYGMEKAAEILFHIYGITIGNKTGNTLDAFRSRLAGVPPRHSSFLFEMLVFIAGAPLVRLLGFKGDVTRKPG